MSTHQWKTIYNIADDAVAEAMRARRRWPVDFDLQNTLNDWAAYINIYLGKATSIGVPHDQVVEELRKVAGLALAVLYHAENGLLAPRHYDVQPAQLPKPLAWDEPLKQSLRIFPITGDVLKLSSAPPIDKKSWPYE